MAQSQVLLVSLVLVSFCGGEAWVAPDFCRGYECPEYTLLEKKQDFEKRLYVDTKWITTEVESTESIALIDANSRLKDYCARQKEAGFDIPVNTWPALITVTEDQQYSLSWFVPPGVRTPENSDESVTVEIKEAGIVYVRSFSDLPSIKGGQENANMLWEDLHHNCPHLSIYSGAGYDPYLSLTHHNEIWIYADDICK